MFYIVQNSSHQIAGNEIAHLKLFSSYDSFCQNLPCPLTTSIWGLPYHWDKFHRIIFRLIFILIFYQICSKFFIVENWYAWHLIQYIGVYIDVSSRHTKQTHFLMFLQLLASVADKKLSAFKTKIIKKTMRSVTTFLQK